MTTFNVSIKDAEVLLKQQAEQIERLKEYLEMIQKQASNALLKGINDE